MSRALSPEEKQAIRVAVQEVDPRQIAIQRKLTPAQRVQMGLSMSDAAIRATMYRMRQPHPEMSEAEAQREVLRRYYANKEKHRG